MRWIGLMQLRECHCNVPVLHSFKNAGSLRSAFSRRDVVDINTTLSNLGTAINMNWTSCYAQVGCGDVLCTLDRTNTTSNATMCQTCTHSFPLMHGVIPFSIVLLARMGGVGTESGKASVVRSFTFVVSSSSYTSLRRE